MTNTKMLKCAMIMAGYTISKMADAMGLSYYGFYKKMTNKSSFKSNEISKASEILGITEKQRNEIFFAECVAKMETESTNDPS